MVESKQNLLEQFIFDNAANQSSAEEESEEEESDENQEPEAEERVQCEDCGKIVPKVKLERHKSYYCTKASAECPLCSGKFLLAEMDEHLDSCGKQEQKLEGSPEDLVRCKVCGATMKKEELKDHAIAHVVEQKQLETQAMMRVVEINEFFEEEKLETGDRTPVLKPDELNELPTKKFTPSSSEQADKPSCRICMSEFEEGDQVRTTRCLHLFHQECLDKWLLTQAGGCPICKVKQAPKQTKETKLETHTRNLIRRLSGGRIQMRLK